MTIEIRPISLEDASFHREMTYVALWDPPDRERRPRSVLDNPKIKAYYENWGKPTDIGYIAEYDNKRVGFAACRIKESVTEEYKEYPELGIAVLPEVQGIGIGDKLLSQLISEAKKRAKKKGRQPTKKHLYLMNWSLYITNAEGEKLPTQVVSLVYGLRWYIELVFKSWKSYHGLAQVRGEREERIECFIYGRLIMIVIMAFLFGSIRRHLWTKRGREASVLKVVRHFQIKAYKALFVIMDSESLASFLFTEFLEACRLCMMDSRTRLTTDQKLRMAKAA